MEAHELAEKFRNNTKTEASYQDVVKWCGENAKDLDLTDKDQQYLYEMATRYLMKIKIGHWDKNDANVIINYFAKVYTNNCGIDNDVVVKILDDPEYREKFNDNSNATCVSYGNGKSEVVYSSRVVDNLTSQDTLKFIRGLQTVFHEVVHSKQYSEIYRPDNGDNQYNGNSYKIALETIMRKVHPKFYKENYTNLIMEYQAEYFGLEQAMKMMETYYKPNLFQGQDIEEFLNEMIKIDGKASYENIGKVSFDQMNINASALITFTADKYIEARPEIIKQIPVLKFAYNSNGSKKDIMQIIQDRANFISNNNEMDLQNIDDLYRTIANYRNFDKNELLLIHEYIEKTGTNDEFVFELMQFRLEKTNWSAERISQFVQEEHAIATKIRQERKEEEIKHEEPESIKDEVGDELKPKTESQKKEEQQVEAMWQNKFQSWDRDSVNLPNSAKRKEDAVKVIQDIERQKAQQEKQQEQEEQDDITNR